MLFNLERSRVVIVERRLLPWASSNANQQHNDGQGRLFCYLASTPCPLPPLAQSPDKMPTCLLVFLLFLYPPWDTAQIQLHNYWL